MNTARFDQKLLIFGATGMLGSALFKYFDGLPSWKVTGVARTSVSYNFLSDRYNSQLVQINELSENELRKIFDNIKPTHIVNCIGLIKQKNVDEISIVDWINVNAMFPHILAKIAREYKCRFIHFSTDCVFSGKKGDYSEIDEADASDVYGKTKFLGEVNDGSALTIRTSIIGQELFTSDSLFNWFLSQKRNVFGYANAYFNGLPTIEVARILDEFLLEKYKISGVLHIGGNVISKYKLLKIIKSHYSWPHEVIRDESVELNRSLKIQNFLNLTGYAPISWERLIFKMKQFEEADNGTKG